jgi:hypothetical protein
LVHNSRVRTFRSVFSLLLCCSLVLDPQTGAAFATPDPDSQPSLQSAFAFDAFSAVAGHLPHRSFSKAAARTFFAEGQALATYLNPGAWNLVFFGTFFAGFFYFFKGRGFFRRSAALLLGFLGAVGILREPLARWSAPRLTDYPAISARIARFGFSVDLTQVSELRLYVDPSTPRDLTLLFNGRVRDVVTVSAEAEAPVIVRLDRFLTPAERELVTVELVSPEGRVRPSRVVFISIDQRRLVDMVEHYARVSQALGSAESPEHLRVEILRLLAGEKGDDLYQGVLADPELPNAIKALLRSLREQYFESPKAAPAPLPKDTRRQTPAASRRLYKESA